MADASDTQAETETVETPAGNGGRWRLIAIGVVVLILIGGFFWLRSRGKESTDDAQVDGHITQIAARVGGTVTKVEVTNNQAVKAGDVLVEIDPRDYQIAVDRAKAELADAQATASAARTGVPIAQVETRSGVSTASGGVQQADAGVSGAEREIPLNGPFNLVNFPLNSGSFSGDGHLLTALASPDSWFYPPGTVDLATGTMTRIQVDHFGDYRVPLRAPDGQIIAGAYDLRAALWRFQPEKK